MTNQKQKIRFRLNRHELGIPTSIENSAAGLRGIPTKPTKVRSSKVACVDINGLYELLDTDHDADKNIANMHEKKFQELYAYEMEMNEGEPTYHDREQGE